MVALGLLALGPTLYQIYANGLSSLTGRSGELRRWSPGNWYARQERMCSSLVDAAHQLRTRG